MEKKKKGKKSSVSQQVCKDMDTTFENLDLCQSVPEGNINTSDTEPDKNNACYRWFFTLKAHREMCVPNVPEKREILIEPKELWDRLNPICKEFYFQLEKGDKTGYIHYQGCFSLTTKHRFMETLNLVGYYNMYLRPAKDWYASKNYTSKDHTAIGKKYNKNSIFIDIPKLQYKWQTDLKNELLNTKPIQRKIKWYYDKKGGKGKSNFTKHMLLTQPEGKIAVCCGGKGNDIAQSLPDYPEIIIMDLPRCNEGYVSYNMIEQMKNGVVFSPKYESRLKVFNYPHIVIFANFMPELDKMSADKWDIIDDFDMTDNLKIEEMIG